MTNPSYYGFTDFAEPRDYGIVECILGVFPDVKIIDKPKPSGVIWRRPDWMKHND